MRNFSLILGTALLIAACGIKGPLVKPPPPAPAGSDASTKTEPVR